jgi:sulfofructose kinase
MPGVGTGLIPVSEYPAAGAKVDCRVPRILPGGQVATAMMACRSWGLSARYVGKLGEDAAAELHRAEFARVGVETRIITAECASHQSFILVEDSGERTVICKRDARLTLLAEELEPAWITDARALHVDGQDTAAAIQAARWAREAGVAVVADIDKLYDGVLPLLGLVDYLIVSRNIPPELTGCSSFEEGLRQMQERFQCRLAAVTLGEEGVLAFDGERFVSAKAFEVEAVDTTGAGDIFHAGFLFGLVKGWELQRTLDFGCAAAALNCSGVGARGGIGSVGEIEGLMRGGLRRG